MGKAWAFTATAFSDRRRNETIGWSDNVRYAMWCVVGGATITGYVEFKASVVKPVMRFALMDASFEPRSARSKLSSQEEVRSASGMTAGPWEYPRQSSSSQTSHAVSAMPPSVIVNVTNYNNVQNNNSVQNNNNFYCDDSLIRDLGDEDLSDFPPERLLELIRQQDFLRFVRETRFNPAKPQNRNLRIVDPHHNRARLKKSGAWHEGTIAQTLDEALTKSMAQFWQPLGDDAALEGGLLDHELHPARHQWYADIVSKKRHVWNRIKSDARGHLMRCYDAYDRHGGGGHLLLTLAAPEPEKEEHE